MPHNWRISTEMPNLAQVTTSTKDQSKRFGETIATFFLIKLSSNVYLWVVTKILIHAKCNYFVIFARQLSN